MKSEKVKPSIGQTSIVEDEKLGSNVTIRNFCNIYGCEIGDDTKIGSFVEIQKGVKIGKKCMIQDHVFIPTGIEIEDEVFIGPHVVFTNDNRPRATLTPHGKMKTLSDVDLKTTKVEFRSTIGANVTILPGIKIGKNSVIGAGSVVTKDVPPNKIVIGNPATIFKDVEDKI